MISCFCACISGAWSKCLINSGYWYADGVTGINRPFMDVLPPVVARGGFFSSRLSSFQQLGGSRFCTAMLRVRFGQSGRCTAKEKSQTFTLAMDRTSPIPHVYAVSRRQPVARERKRSALKRRPDRSHLGSQQPFVIRLAIPTYPTPANSQRCSGSTAPTLPPERDRRLRNSLSWRKCGPNLTTRCAAKALPFL